MRQLFGKLLLIGFVLTFVLLPAGAALRGPALPGTAVWADTNVDDAYSDDEADYEEPAEEPAVLPDQRLKPRLTDDADLLTSSEEKQLLAKLDEISERQEMDVVVVTTDSLEGKTAEAYADDFFDYNGFGYGPMGSGVLLLVSMEDRDWAISTSGDGIEAFTDAGQARRKSSAAARRAAGILRIVLRFMALFLSGDALLRPGFQKLIIFRRRGRYLPRSAPLSAGTVPAGRHSSRHAGSSPGYRASAAAAYPFPWRCTPPRRCRDRP